MKPSVTSLPGYRLCEYLLVIAPGEALRSRVLKIKDAFAEAYKAPAARHGRPHIALVSFATWSQFEEKLGARLQQIAMGVTPFKVEVRGYGSYPTHSLFLNVITRLPVQNLVRALKAAQRLMKVVNDTKPHFIEDPHILIATNLKPWQYEAGWGAYKSREFTGRFIADGMLLLKRPAGERGAWQVARRFDFENLPVATRQGSLFG